MPIRGISEVRRYPRLGKVRLGIKEQSKRTQAEYPKAVDYFVCNEDESTSAQAAGAFHRVYGDKPRELDIMFPCEDESQFFQQWYRCYAAGAGLICKGDGQTAMRLNRATGELEEIECCPQECEFTGKNHCRPVGTLLFLLWTVPGLGVWQIDTSSYHSIVNLNSAITFIRGLTGGRIAMLPLKLVLRPKEVQVTDEQKGTTYRKTIWVLDLANENVTLSRLLGDARKPLEQILALPEVDMSKPPDDLYPASIVNAGKEQPAPANSDPPAEARPEPTVPTAEVEAADATERAGSDKDDPVEREIAKAFELLGWTPAKQALWRRKASSPQELLNALQREADKAVAREERQGPEPEQTGAKTAGRPTKKGPVESVAPAGAPAPPASKPSAPAAQPQPPAQPVQRAFF